ncbi:hypothetical protein [Mycoplasma miroungirhinis]|uniref:Uncharacterized protein n=1 Tax=Mycoplasma miroungirhinis TaxID=754516 RepID=A0A6M4JBH1_9MOLU|nr:hypothetical protein [Mycoplasma miroungirhinis]QJR44260.1 hypothetical protein HLA92_02330 [Mycoplasma miroungirhinis]
MEDNWLTIAKIAGYALPLKSVMTEENVEFINKLQKQYLQRVEELENKLELNLKGSGSFDDQKLKSITQAKIKAHAGLTNEEQKEYEDSIAYYNKLESAKISIQSVLGFLNSNTQSENVPQNEKIGNVFKIIDEDLLNTTKEGSEQKTTTPEEFYKEIQDILK